MRANANRGGGYNEPNDEVLQGTNGAVGDSTASPGVTPGDQDNVSSNTKGAKKYAAYYWLGLLVLYFGWNYLQHRKNIATELKPENVKANAHNIAVITLASVIGINGLNVLCTKLAAMKIPGISRLAGAMLPLVSL